jgi:hypothetical protein
MDAFAPQYICSSTIALCFFFLSLFGAFLFYKVWHGLFIGPILEKLEFFRRQWIPKIITQLPPPHVSKLPKLLYIFIKTCKNLVKFW